MATRLAPDCWLAEPAAAAPVVVPCPDGEAAGLAPEAEAAGSLDPAELARLTGAVWNFSTPRRPTRVPATTIGARFMTASLLSRSTASSTFPCSLEPERLKVDLLGRNAKLPRYFDKLGTETRRPADVDVTRDDVGHEVAQVSCTQADLVPRPDKLVQAAAALLDQGGNLVSVHQPGRRGRADDHRDVRLLRQVLEQRAQRRDTHAGPDEQHAICQPRVVGEGSVRPLDGDGGTGSELGHEVASIAGRLDRDPEVWRARQRREREGVRLPPEVPGEKPPLEELPAGYGQLVKVLALADDRDDAGRLVPHLDDAELVLQAPPDRLADPEGDDHARRGDPDRDPQCPGQRVANEGHAGDDLMGEGEREAEVEVQVDGPPCLVPKPAPDRAIGSDPGQYEQAEPDDCCEYVPVRADQHPQLVHQRRPVRLRVAESDRDDVRNDQPDRPRGDLPVPPDELILADGALQPGQPGDEHDHDEQQVGAGERRQPADRREQPARRRQRSMALVRQHGRDDRAEADAR